VQNPAPALLLALLLAGCVPAAPSTTQYPAPVASAAQPAVAGKGDTAYVRRAIEAIRVALKEYVTDGADTQLLPDRLTLPDAGVEAQCAAASGSLPVLACHFGPNAAQPVAQALFWPDRAAWQAQLYPQAPTALATERRTGLSGRGCQIGCYSGLVQARQALGSEGRELLVVADLGLTSGQRAQEAHLLRLTDDGWKVVWAPAPGNWNYGHAQVELSSRGLNQFAVRSSSWLREDSFTGYVDEQESSEHRQFRERWMRKDSGYVMVDRLEEPTPYGSLVRLIHYLSGGAEEKAQVLLAPGVSLEEARKTLAQKPRRQGWKATRWGEHGFLLDTRQEGKPTLGVRFEQQDAEWVLAELWQPER
jgi:hypothetical protein